MAVAAESGEPKPRFHLTRRARLGIRGTAWGMITLGSIGFGGGFIYDQAQARRPHQEVNNENTERAIFIAQAGGTVAIAGGVVLMMVEKPQHTEDRKNGKRFRKAA